MYFTPTRIDRSLTGCFLVQAKLNVDYIPPSKLAEYARERVSRDLKTIIPPGKSVASLTDDLAAKFKSVRVHSESSTISFIHACELNRCSLCCSWCTKYMKTVLLVATSSFLDINFRNATDHFNFRPITVSRTVFTETLRYGICA